jgi:predicted transcriptional regulator
MLSIRPKWSTLITIGEKTVEVRKTRPKIEPPFKCYIYETKAESEIPWVDEDGHFIYKGRGAVIGEFVCDRIAHRETYLGRLGYWNDDANPIPAWKTAMSESELINYSSGKRIYGWHISDIVIYDTPRPLSDFGLRRPPQSWCYVKKVEA